MAKPEKKKGKEPVQNTTPALDDKAKAPTAPTAPTKSDAGDSIMDDLMATAPAPSNLDAAPPMVVDEKATPSPSGSNETPKKRGPYKPRKGKATLPDKEKTPEQMALDKEAAIETSGVTMANMTIGTFSAFLGPEFASGAAPTKQDDFVLLKEGYKNYFRAKGDIEVSPGVALAMCILAYIIPRFAMDSVKAKFKKWFGKKEPKTDEAKKEKKEGENG